MTKLGMAAAYPRIPGHEIAGVVDAVGAGVSAWTPGQRVGVGWYGGACFTCDPCRRGDFIDCQHLRVPGLSDDGGYAAYATFPSDALAAIPDALTAPEAAPLMCAGVTTFNGLRSTQARAGELVAILGIGGLGHLGVQFAAKMGFETVAIARGQDKADFAHQMGAHHYIDSTSQDVAGELTKLGGASVVLATVTNGPAMAAIVAGLRARGELVVLGVPQEPLEIPAVALIMATRSVAGHPSGTAKDSRRHFALCRAHRYPAADRDDAARRRREGLRPDDVWRCAVPRRPHHELGHEAVAQPRLGQEMLRPGRVGLELAAQLGHVDPQVVGLGVVGRTPDFGQQLAARHELPGVAYE